MVALTVLLFPLDCSVIAVEVVVRMGPRLCNETFPRQIRIHFW